MDGSRFDAWTRRRFGLAAGGALGALLGLGERADASHGRCKHVLEGCSPSGDRRRCCKSEGLQCRRGDDGLNRCCRKGGAPCREGSQQKCCSGDCRNGTCFCKGVGQPCGENSHCCSFRCDTLATFRCLSS